MNKLTQAAGLIAGAMIFLFQPMKTAEAEIQPSPYIEEIVAADSILNEGEVAPVQSDEPVIDESELDLLSRLIFAEAGSSTCSYEMKYLVGAVALNRVKSNDFPDSLIEVVYQDEPLQYACVKDGHINYQPTQECIQIAYELLVNGTDIPETVVFQSEFIQGSGVYKQIDNMYFCYR